MIKTKKADATRENENKWKRRKLAEIGWGKQTRTRQNEKNATRRERTGHNEKEWDGTIKNGT